ncbi:MAG: KOW motif-containing protein [Muribaculaceae bacterium]|nr:KOW motif-containing protein [Muribaculaceae bacterium]
MQTSWFAIKTHQDFRAEKELAPLCEDLLFPKEEILIPGKKARTKAFIPRVLFIKTTREKALGLEREGRRQPEQSVPFWIYRYPKDNRIQEISPESIRLLRLLTAQDTTRCEIFTKKDFKEGQHVRVIGGPFQGYEGIVTRVKKDRHVIVKIEGICLIMLPFIHPDLLQEVN